MNRKIIALSTALGLSMSMSTTTIAADYNQFLSPSSLGKNVKALSSQYKLGLKKQSWGGYSNSEAYDCMLNVEVNSQGRINSIRAEPNNEKCSFKTASSGVTYNTESTKIIDILNQADIDSIKFLPGCFNCPSGLELADNLVISRPQDNYYTEFEIEGYNNEYLKFMGTKLIGNFNQNNYYSIMDKLDAKLDSDSPEYNRKDFKLKAIKSYDLQQQPWSYYKIGLK